MKCYRKIISLLILITSSFSLSATAVEYVLTSLTSGKVTDGDYVNFFTDAPLNKAMEHKNKRIGDFIYVMTVEESDGKVLIKSILSKDEKKEKERQERLKERAKAIRDNQGIANREAINNRMKIKTAIADKKKIEKLEIQKKARKLAQEKFNKLPVPPLKNGIKSATQRIKDRKVISSFERVFRKEMEKEMITRLDSELELELDKEAEIQLQKEYEKELEISKGNQTKDKFVIQGLDYTPQKIQPKEYIFLKSQYEQIKEKYYLYVLVLILLLGTPLLWRFYQGYQIKIKRKIRIKSKIKDIEQTFVGISTRQELEFIYSTKGDIEKYFDFSKAEFDKFRKRMNDIQYKPEWQSTELDELIDIFSKFKRTMKVKSGI